MEIEIMMFWLSSIYIGPIWALMWFAPKHDFTKKFVGNIRLTVLPPLHTICNCCNTRNTKHSAHFR